MHSKTGNYLTSSLEQNERLFDKYLPEVLLNPKKENIHRIRVTIKRMNANYRLLEFIFAANFNHKEHYHTVRKIFQSLGKLRDLQVNNSYIKSSHLSGTFQKLYTEFYSTQKDKARKNYKKALKKFDKDSLAKSLKMARKLSRNLSNREVLVKTRQFIMKEKEKIKYLLKEYDTPEKVHEIRKHLKVLNYNTASLNTPESGTELNTLISNLKKTESLIGAWHDRVKLIQFIHTFIDQVPSSKSGGIEPFNKMISRLSRENATTLNQLKPKLENIMLTLNLI